jgi:sterol desaturase/sphingolipid hydroxylase (fatty acid hydroxylase superfamily)
MAINKRLLIKSISASLLIAILLMVMAYLPIWSIMTELEKSKFSIYPLIISFFVIFCILTIIFYFDIRKILERKSL